MQASKCEKSKYLSVTLQKVIDGFLDKETSVHIFDFRLVFKYSQIPTIVVPNG